MMMTSLPESISNYLLNASLISDSFQVSSVSGGDISQAYKVESSSGSVFIKVNHADRLPMFQAEAKGLEILKTNSKFLIPKVIAADEVDQFSFLILEFIEASFDKDQSSLGVLLAEMHQNSRDQFGLDHSNFIATLEQSNTNATSWQEFYSTQRIEPLFKMAFDAGYFSSKDRKNIDLLTQKLEDIVPVEKPSLLHGDLWAGNYMRASQNKHVLIDPAIYYGHREMDIAMMHLFGGFKAEVFEEYQNTWPLENAWQERLSFHNLYPLLVHVNLFGASYALQVKSGIVKYL